MEDWTSAYHEMLRQEIQKVVEEDEYLLDQEVDGEFDDPRIW